VDNIEIDLREIGWDGMDWIDLAQDRDQWRALVNTVLKQPIKNFLTFYGTRRFISMFTRTFHWSLS
jgi:hypothetical protein